MNASEPDTEPAINAGDALTPILPGPDRRGPLKDMAQEIVAASARLEGRIAPPTAEVLGDKLRLINSYYSNLIEGHKTTIPDIESALRNDFDRDPEKKSVSIKSTSELVLPKGGSRWDSFIHWRNWGPASMKTVNSTMLRC